MYQSDIKLIKKKSLFIIILNIQFFYYIFKFYILIFNILYIIIYQYTVE